MSVPLLCVEVPVEGRVVAYLLCGSEGEERRLLLDVAARDWLGEIMAELDRPFAALDEYQEGTP